MKLLRAIAVLPIRFYRRFITPWTPATCRFQPTCSAFGEQAILTHGILKGALLTLWRILRCHPLSAPGPDPVPPLGRWRAPLPSVAPADNDAESGVTADAEEPPPDAP